MKKILVTLVLTVFICIYSNGQRGYFIPNLTVNMTVRILVNQERVIKGKKDTIAYVGTGFFYEFDIDTFKIKTIVTNYHVIKNSIKGKLVFKDVQDYKFYEKPITHSVIINDFEKLWIVHPNEDLAILPLDIVSNLYKEKNNKAEILYTWMSKANIPTLKDSLTISSIEKVLMVGYPKALWDSSNNSPIVRQGITATPYFSDFNNKKRFLIDIPTFEGSSGSPVLLYSFDPYFQDTLWVTGTFRNYFLGIAVESPVYDAEGRIVKSNGIRTQDSLTNAYEVKTAMPINIATVIKAEKLIEFIPLLKEYLSNKKK